MAISILVCWYPTILTVLIVFCFLNVSFDQSIVRLYRVFHWNNAKSPMILSENHGKTWAIFQPCDKSCEVEVANLSFDLICNL